MKILQILYEINNGGIETILLNYLENMNIENIEMDIVVSKNGSQVQENKYKKLGCKIFYIGDYRENIIKTYRSLNKIIKDGNYDIVHSRLNYRSFLPLLIAKKNHVPVRIAHSHVSNEPQTFKRKFEKILLTIFTKLYATDYMACSNLAGEWFLGDEFREIDNAYILYNSIDIQKYKYNDDIRIQLREKYHLNDKFVIGNVARFTSQKNHSFLIEIFQIYVNTNPNSVLFLIGDGPDMIKIKTQVLENKLIDKVIFLGVTDCPEIYYNIFDIFLLPSQYEGWGNVLIEAQANGLKCIASKDVIPQETNITNLIQFIPLNKKKEWVDAIINNSNPYDRNKGFNILNKTNYNICNASKYLENLYLNLLNLRQ